MEVVGAIVGSALTEPFRFLFGSIYARIKNVFKIHSNYDDLDEKMKILLDFTKQLPDDELQLRQLPRMRIWLSRVEKLQKAFDSMRSTVTANGSTGCVRSLDCRLGNNIAKGLVEVKQLIEDGKEFENMIVPDTVDCFPAPSIEGQETASRNLKELMDVLGKEENKRIGVWGMGGVGKTTLVKNLINKLNEDPTSHTFSIVKLVVVSQNATVESVQSKIAERLNLAMHKEESTESRAHHLHSKLKGKKFLLILDDIWEGVDLNDVGIPSLESHIGSKIILTTRKLNVCQRMNTDKDLSISSLSPEEAWDLFSERVGKEVVNDEQIKPFAEDIVRECDGLPLAIITVGASLRKKTEVALWNTALSALQRSEPTLSVDDVEEKVYKPLKWSYDSLKSKPNLKSCFLFCCLFPEDFEIDIHDLVQYWLAEGLLEEQQNYEHLLDEVKSIVDHLKDCCLLEEGLSYIYTGKVKMHDVVRDVGVWIAKSSKDWCKSIIRCGINETQISKQLFDCSDKVKRVSFMNSKIKVLPNDNIQCPEAAALFLRGNHDLCEVPNSFLQGFQMLRTLDLSDTSIKLLPDSLLQLCELRALILRGCIKLSELLAGIDVLGKLQILDCSWTSIAKLPAGFEKLTSLRILDVNMTSLGEIPAGKFCNLHKLECLKMEDSGIKWGRGNRNEGNAAFEDLLCLNQLIALYIDLKGIPCVTTQQHASWFRRIKNFSFNVNRRLGSRNGVYLEKHLFSGDESCGLLLLNASRLYIDECEEVDVMFDSLVTSTTSLGPFVNLQELRIFNCCVFGKPSSSSVGDCISQINLVPNLELLRLNKVSGLKSLSHITNFLGPSFNKQLHVYIEECEDLIQVFAPMDNFIPNCWYLTLLRLPALEEIYKGNAASWESLERLKVIECNMLRKLPLGIQNAQRQIFIEGEQHWWDGLEWDIENSKERLQQHFELQTS